MLPRIVDALCCPVCGEHLHDDGASLRCAHRHTFDVARQGYVNLLTGGGADGTADTPDMVRSRAAFLAAGHYVPLTKALAGLAGPLGDGFAVETGAGTGHHLAGILDAFPAAVGLALDLSKFAIRRAARAHPRMGAGVWNVWRPMPVRSGAADLVLDVFAPRNAVEFHRVLRPGGVLLVATPAPEHLAELIPLVGLLSIDPDKGAKLGRALRDHFRLDRREEHTVRLALSPAEVENVVRMGPTAHHVDGNELRRRIDALPAAIAVTAAFTVAAYRPLTNHH